MRERNDLELNNLLKVKEELENIFKSFKNHEIFHCKITEKNYENMKSKQSVLSNEYMIKCDKVIQLIKLHKDDVKDLKLTNKENFENYYKEKLECFESASKIIMQCKDQVEKVELVLENVRKDCRTSEIKNDKIQMLLPIVFIAGLIISKAFQEIFSNIKKDSVVNKLLFLINFVINFNLNL